MPGRSLSSIHSGLKTRLSKPAARLLAMLAGPGMAALPDPSREGFVILRCRRGGISLGRGGHPLAVIGELERRDLVTARGKAGPWTISAAGRARLLRDEAERGGQDDSFARQHREIDVVGIPTDTGVAQASVNMRESPLVWLRRRRGPDGEPLIDAAAFEAGERLRRDTTMADLLPSVTARWDGAIGGGGRALRDPAAATDAVIAARQRVRAALDAVGPELAGLLLDLCGFLKGVETIERDRRWPQRSGKIVIRLALGQLARHYGLSSEATGRSASRGIATWFAEEGDGQPGDRLPHLLGS